MAQHITVRGTPWCECMSRLATYGISYDDPHKLAALANAETALDRDAKAHGIQYRCMNSYPSDEAAVELLRRHGIDAEITEGRCPSTSTYIPED